MRYYDSSLWDAARAVAASSSIWGMVNQDTVMSVASASVAVALFVVPVWNRLRSDVRKASVQRDQAEAESWSTKYRELTINAAKFEGKLDAALAENAMLKAKLERLAVQQDKVTHAVKVEQQKRKVIENRVGEVEKVQGASSQTDLPATPETAIDLPTEG